MTRCWLSVAFRRSTTARPAPIEPVSRRLSQIVIPLCHSPYRTSDSVLVAPNSDRQRGDMCKILNRQWICWDGALWRTSIITDSPLSFYPKIHSNCRLPLGRAQGGAFSRRSRNVPQPACRTVGQRGPHIYKRDHRVDSTFSLRIYWSKYGTFRVGTWIMRAIQKLGHARSTWTGNARRVDVRQSTRARSLILGSSVHMDFWSASPTSVLLKTLLSLVSGTYLGT